MTWKAPDSFCLERSSCAYPLLGDRQIWPRVGRTLVQDHTVGSGNATKFLAQTRYLVADKALREGQSSREERREKKVSVTSPRPPEQRRKLPVGPGLTQSFQGVGPAAFSL